MGRRTLAVLTVTAVATAAMLVSVDRAEAQSWRTMHSARQLWDREPLDVQIRYGAGELRVEPATGPMLYELEMRYDERRWTPLTEYDPERRSLRLGLESRGRARNINGDGGSHARFALTREVPLDLDLEFGAGEADLELGGISLRRLQVSTGASATSIRFGAPNPVRAERVEIQAGAAALTVTGLGNTRARTIDFKGGVGSTTLDFTGAWDGDSRASVQMGLGEIRLRLPRGIGVRLNKSSFLTSFDSQGLIKQGSSFYSRDWETAQHRITIDLDAAIGSVAVEWVG